MNIRYKSPSHEQLKDMIKIAKLRNAAPDLLKACKTMLNHLLENDFDSAGTPEWMIEQAQAAIKKAEDEQA